MSDLRKAAEMALEALEDIFGKEKKDVGAINALRQALDYPTPEQIALAQQIRPKGKSRIGQALAQTKEQGVIIYRTGYESGYMDASVAAKREWVGLTDEEVESWRGNYDFFNSALVREVEAKLKEKNGF